MGHIYHDLYNKSISRRYGNLSQHLRPKPNRIGVVNYRIFKPDAETRKPKHASDHDITMIR